MQKAQTKGEVDGLLGSMSADGEHTLTENYGEALETLPIEGTPFQIITDKNKEPDKGSFIAMGGNRLTEWIAHEEAKQMIENRDWRLITNMVVQYVLNIVTDLHEQREIQKQIESQLKK